MKAVRLRIELTKVSRYLNFTLITSSILPILDSETVTQHLVSSLDTTARSPQILESNLIPRKQSLVRCRIAVGMPRSNSSFNPSSAPHTHLDSYGNQHAPIVFRGPGSTPYAQAGIPGDRYVKPISARNMNSLAQGVLPRSASYRKCEGRSMQHQSLNKAASQGPLDTTHRAHASTVTDILPYCTTEPPLTQEQVIAISDIAGSLQELALLALSAATGDTARENKLIHAVGPIAASNIADFFIGEWEVE